MREEHDYLVSLMKPEMKTRWIEALRSGEYQQCQKGLKMVNGNPTYCCLGVLTEIVAAELDLKWTVLANGEFHGIELKEAIEDSWLVKAVMDHCGLDQTDPTVHIKVDHKRLSVAPEDKINVTLSVLNDQGYSFDEIADIIEENL